MQFSKLDICNRALRLAGEHVISSLSDVSRNADECAFLYPIVKDEIIGCYPWHCAQKELSLKAIYDPEQEASSRIMSPYHYKFLLPFDCVNVQTVDRCANFKRDGLYLYASKDEITLFYTASIPEDLMSLRLCKMISLRLALELALVLSDNEALINRLHTLNELELKKLTQLDSEEGQSIFKAENNSHSGADWLASR